jgi:hypothetical protein
MRSDTTKSRQQIYAAPIRQASIFKGSRIIRPKRTLTPLNAQLMSPLKRCSKWLE